MNSLPVRFFHACLTGLFTGLILALLFFHIQGRFQLQPPAPDRIVVIEPSPPPTPSPTPVATDPPANPDDAIPNEWEIQFHHDPAVNDAGSDFDNDGLTALQEYQLYQQTAGVSGNPLGKWSTETLQPPPDLGIQYFYPQDINRNGEILLNAGMVTDGEYHDGSIFVDEDREWKVIHNPDSPSPYLCCSDLNDMGTVAGYRYSNDWSEYDGFVWSATDGYQTLFLDGEKTYLAKINNHGDWVGYRVDVNGNWLPAYVVNGINMHSDRDWWPYVWYQDINDFGEALGTYSSADYISQHAFLAYGPWVHDTGLQGSAPEFDPDTYSWNNSIALNAWGEFTAGAGGLRNGNWAYPGYVFDGEFREIQSSRLDPYYLYPSSLSDDKTATGVAYDSSWTGYGFIHRDGITVRIDEVIPSANGSNVVFCSGDRRMVTMSADGQSILVISPDQDQDGDGMSDDWEDYYGSNKNSAADATADADNDGTNNLGEFLLRSHPNEPPVPDENGQQIDLRPGIDTDGDGIPNVWEWQHGLAYDDATDAPLDFDRDGYTNLQEYHLNTEPRGAPSYRMRVIGPFPGANGANLQVAVLGDGLASGNSTYLGGNITETVQFPASPDVSNGQRPASWSVPRSGITGAFSISSSLSNTYCNPMVHSPSGASLYYRSANPSQFFYWSSPTAKPVTLSGAANENDISYLYNPRISPSGTFLVGQRYSVTTSTYQAVVWKMPTSPTTTFKPIRLLPPVGAALSDWTPLQVNDHGYVMANGNVSGQNRPILWKVSADGTTATATILPPLPGSNWANATGISNQDPPLICGTSSASNQQRAVVWTAAGAVTNLGTLLGGNYSSATLISRGGSIAGISNVLVGNTLKQQPFLATYNAASSSWKLQAQGEPLTHYTSLSSINNFGEIIGTIYEYTPTFRQIRTLWRHGRAHPIESCFSGATLDNVTQLSPHGTLLGTVNKDGSKLTVLLTPDRDTDSDGLSDAYENQHGFNAFVKNNPAADSDSDTLTDLEELRNNTDPRNPDTDGDGMKDGFEVSWGLLPLDPSDAPLDPDNDRVTNLRESQIGTTPTGIYKVETRLTDTEWFYPTIIAASDDGQIVHTGQSFSNNGTDENGITLNEYGQKIHTLPAAGSGASGASVELPGYHNYDSYNSDWTEFTYYQKNPSYRIDSSTGKINGDMYWWGGDQSTYGNASETRYLTPDAANVPEVNDVNDWISWSTIEANLRDPNLHDGNAPLADFDSLNIQADAVSPSGNRRLHHSNGAWEYFVITESGELVEKLTENWPWQSINDDGVAIGIETVYWDSEENWVEDSPLLFLSTGETIPIPNEPGVPANFTLLRFSNDGKALLSSQVQNEQLTYITQHFLFDINTGTLTRILRPGLGYENIELLSNQNSRLLGTGPKPFQITPDGTCIRLEALRIKNSPADDPVTFGSLYPRTLTPNHIASGGRITLTTTNSQNQQVILQLEPFNDADNDGMPDDWENSTIDELITNDLIVTAPTNENGSSDMDPEVDYDGDGIPSGLEYVAGTSDANPDDYNEVNVTRPLIWYHNRIAAGDTKTGFFKEFTPNESIVGSDPPVPPKYYMKRKYKSVSEATTTYSHHKVENSSTTTIDRHNHSVSEIWDPTVYTGTQSWWPDWWSGAWNEISNDYNRTTTKTKDTSTSTTNYGRPTTDGDNATGSDYFFTEYELLEEYSTTMLIEDGNKKFDEWLAEENSKPWQKSWSNWSVADITTYLYRDESLYDRMQCDYALEPILTSPIKPVRIAWLEIDQPNLKRGLLPAINDDSTPPVVKLRQEYYSSSGMWRFWGDPWERSQPVSEIRTLAPALNHELHVIPLECSLHLHHASGSIIATVDGSGQTIAPDWTRWDSGSLSWDLSHSTGSSGDFVSQEFDVPVKLEAIKGGEKIRLAYRLIDAGGNVTYTPLALPIADLRNYPNGFVLQTIAPGEVVLKASLSTKHGLRVSSRSKGKATLPVPQIYVEGYGENGEIGDMVASVKTTNPEMHFVTPAKTDEIPDENVMLYATGIDYRLFDQFYKWEPNTGSSSGNAGSDMIGILSHRVSRLAPDKFPVKILEKSTGKEIAKVNVWVVWADSSVAHTGKTKFHTSFFGSAIDRTIGGALTDFAMLNVLQIPNHYFRFVFTIQPSSIITGLNAGQDVPDLSGKLPSDVQVPGGDGVHPILGDYQSRLGSGGKYKFGASHYWDVSRQMQVTINNPNMIPKNDFAENWGDLYSTQPQASSIPVSFPSDDPVMGNDDVGTDAAPMLIAPDESNDPYVANTNGDLSHPIGQITSLDAPKSQITVAAGAENRGYEELNEFREFVRLKLPGGWYRVSDYVEWRFDFKANFSGGQWRDNGCYPVPTP